MSEVEVKLDGESNPTSGLPVQAPAAAPVPSLPVSAEQANPTPQPALPKTQDESPLDDELPQRIEPIQSSGFNNNFRFHLFMVY